MKQISFILVVTILGILFIPSASVNSQYKGATDDLAKILKPHEKCLISGESIGQKADLNRARLGRTN